MNSMRTVIKLVSLVFCTPLAAHGATFNLPPSPSPVSIGSGDVVNLFDGGSLASPFVVPASAALHIFGGELETPNSYFYGLEGSEINFHSGDLGAVEYGSRGVFNLFSGNPGDFGFHEGVSNLYGGDAGKNGSISGTVNVYGGIFQDNFLGFDQGTLNIFGRQFSIDGDVVQGLIPGIKTPILERNVVLSGLLQDGTPFSFSLDLANGGIITPGFVAPSFTVTATLVVAEPVAGNAMLLATIAVSTVLRRRCLGV